MRENIPFEKGKTCHFVYIDVIFIFTLFFFRQISCQLPDCVVKVERIYPLFKAEVKDQIHTTTQVKEKRKQRVKMNEVNGSGVHNIRVYIGRGRIFKEFWLCSRLLMLLSH